MRQGGIQPNIVTHSAALGPDDNPTTVARDAIFRGEIKIWGGHDDGHRCNHFLMIRRLNVRLGLAIVRDALLEMAQGHPVCCKNGYLGGYSHEPTVPLRILAGGSETAVTATTSSPLNSDGGANNNCFPPNRLKYHVVKCLKECSIHCEIERGAGMIRVRSEYLHRIFPEQLNQSDWSTEIHSSFPWQSQPDYVARRRRPVFTACTNADNISVVQRA